MLGNLRITAKLIIWFLFIALLPMGAATFFSYESSKRAVENEAKERLFAVAENKTNQIESYLREKEKDLTQLSFASDLRLAMGKFREAYDKQGSYSPEYEVVNHEYRPFLEYYQRIAGYNDLLLVSPDGDVVFSVQKKRYTKLSYKRAHGQDLELADVFARTVASTSLKTEVSNFEYDQETRKLVAYLAIPVLSSGNYAGTLVVKMDNRGISELVRDYTGMGTTGETIVAARIGNEAVALTPLRFGNDTSLNMKIPLGSNSDKGLQKAVLGENGSGTSPDYRGKATLALWRHLAAFHLGIVVKMDTDEVFVSAEELRNNLLVVSSVLLGIVLIVAILVAHTISYPIKDLTKISRVITNGNLSERAKTVSEDEIGELAQSFNQMTDSLVRAKSHVEEQKKLLEKVNKELDSFVYTASHDLRAPLRAISSFSGFLEDDYKNKLDKDGKENLSEIRKGANRMTRLIEDLLTLSRISRVKNPYEDVNMKDLVNSVVERIKFDITQNKVDLKLDDNMPKVHCDRIKMGEVFQNLINNAIKFSSKNNKNTPRVEVGYADKGEGHEFFVKDNGIGIDHKHQQDVFGIFRRLQTTQEYEGTGAGLAIVKRIIDDHEGRIWVESELGKGATFRFTIPKSRERVHA